MIKCNNECPLKKFDGCCHSCPHFEGCEEACESEPNTCGEAIFDEEAGLITFQEQQLAVLQQVADLITAKKKIEEQEKNLKDKLKEAMEKFNVKKFESDILNITYVAATSSTSIDSAKLKKKYPTIAEECSKVSAKSAYIKVTVKGDDK